ncbi:hypothetical protein LZ32DRAFT_329167 [Colletotrichum eremochloae]|nr:hypothetical protein LZ32DRAFT_329167 [Colletotrichum eremochloae]
MNNTQQQPPMQAQPQVQPQQPQGHPQQYAPQASTSTPPPMIVTPTWMVVIRGIQFFLAIVILGLSAAIIHWVYLDELGLAVAISLFTWIIVLYAVLTEKLPSARGLYHAYAVLALDLFLVILWLATMGACAARRAAFVVPVTASCSSDGSAVNSGHCTIYKRYVVMSNGALAMFAAIAGLSALQFVLFLVTFVWAVVQFARWRKLNAPAAQAGASQGEIQMESKQPFMTQQPAYQQPQNGHVQQQQQQQQFYPPQQYQQQPPQQYQEMPGQPQPQQQQQYQEMPGQPQQQQYPPQTTSPAPTYVQQPPHDYQQYQQQQQQYPAQPYAPSPSSSPAPGQGQTQGYPPQELR